MLMNVLEAFIGVIAMQHATTIKEVTLALATLDTQAVDFLAQVRNCMFFFFFISIFCVMYSSASALQPFVHVCVWF